LGICIRWRRLQHRNLLYDKRISFFCKGSTHTIQKSREIIVFALSVPTTGMSTRALRRRRGARTVTSEILSTSIIVQSFEQLHP
jgi:hypothetical protein